MSTISFKKSSESYEGVEKSLNDLKEIITPNILESKVIVVKINFVSVLKKLATTPVESVKAFIDFTKEIGYKDKIIIAETATQGLTKLGFNSFGFVKLAGEYENVEILDLRKDESLAVNLVDASGEEFPVEYSKTIKEADYVVSICRAKTHNEVGVTLAIKNLAVGGIIHRRYQVHQGTLIHENIKRLTKFRKPDLSIIDGVTGMEGNGPISGSPINSNWVIASDDCVTSDTLGAHMMGFVLKDAGYLRLCEEVGLGSGFNSRDVIFVGDSFKDNITEYKPHSNFEDQPKI